MIEGVDSVVLALGSVANNGLYEALKGKVPDSTLSGRRWPRARCWIPPWMRSASAGSYEERAGPARV